MKVLNVLNPKPYGIYMVIPLYPPKNEGNVGIPMVGPLLSGLAFKVQVWVQQMQSYMP